MNQKDKDFVRKNYIKLADAMAPQVDDVIEVLYVNDIISNHMKENIIDNSYPSRKKARLLLDLIQTRGSRGLDHLYVAVLEEKLYDAADILKPGNSPHNQTQLNISASSRSEEYDSPDEGLPDKWPTEAEVNAYKNLRVVDAVRHKKMVALFNETFTPKGRENIYLMSARVRGQVLIINNEVFTYLQKRDGTLADRKALETLFCALNFDVRVEKNKTKDEMWKVLEEESAREYHRDANCFVLFILSHGYTGVVFGTDGVLHDKTPINCIEVKKIVDLFSKSKSLIGKPKLFFIQACQGAEKDQGQPVNKPDTDSSENKDLSSNLNTGDGATNVEGQDTVQQDAIIWETKKVLDNVIQSTQSDSDSDTRPSGADVFVAMATIPGFLSWRNTKIGTWFIQAIAYVFAKYAYKYDLGRLMTKVNNLVGRGETERGKYKQVGEKKDTLQKDLYFFPGLSDNQ